MRTEDGYAALEAFLLGLVLLLPLVWLLGVSGDLHRAALASASAVREAGLAASRAASSSEAQQHAHAAVRRALSERGLSRSGASVTVSWDRGFGRGELIEIGVQLPVRVLHIPFVRQAVGPAVWVKARHVARVEPYRSRG